MKPRRLVPVFISACLALAAASTDALAAPSHLAEIADRGVVAVQDPSGLRTGFVFGNANLVIASTSVNAGVHLITAHGVSILGDTASRDGDLAAVHAPALHLLPLRRSGVREISSGTLAFVLGAPLGYEGERIRAVRLPAIKLHDTGTVIVAGQLPRSFQGAPVVTHAGKVIGAVAAVGASGWTLAPQVRLSTLVAAATKANGGEGIPVVSILVGVLIVIAALGGLVVMRTRRRHGRAERAPVVVHQRPIRAPTQTTLRDPTQHSTQPLVRRRGPESDDHQEEDFDIVLKSHEKDA